MATEMGAGPVVRIEVVSVVVVCAPEHIFVESS